MFDIVTNRTQSLKGGWDLSHPNYKKPEFGRAKKEEGEEERGDSDSVSSNDNCRSMSAYNIRIILMQTKN